MAVSFMALPKVQPREILFSFVLLIAYSLAGQAQEGGDWQDSKPPRETDYTLSLSKAFVQPGNEVSVMVLFAQKPDTPSVKKLRARFAFPSNVLTFERMEDAYLSRRAKLVMKVLQAGGISTNEAALDLIFEMPADSEAAFPSGQIATLTFKVANTAEDQVIRLNPEAWIEGKLVEPESPDAKVEYGLVKITQVPVVVGCFFFTH